MFCPVLGEEVQQATVNLNSSSKIKKITRLEFCRGPPPSCCLSFQIHQHFNAIQQAEAKQYSIAHGIES